MSGDKPSPDTDPGSVAERLIAFVQDASRVALDLKTRGLGTTFKDGDLGSALTKADLEISRMAHAAFGPRVIEEESAAELSWTDAASMMASSEWTFVFDPIDGTMPFAGGLSSWGIMAAACRNGWPEVGVVALPEWDDPRSRPLAGERSGSARGIIVAAFDGVARIARTGNGLLDTPFAPVPRPTTPTGHVAWGIVPSARYVLDFSRGLFPWGESAYAADIALIAAGRLDGATVLNKLWDNAPAIPVFEAMGFGLYRWPDLARPRRDILSLYDRTFSARELWLVSRSETEARALASAIRKV